MIPKRDLFSLLMLSYSCILVTDQWISNYVLFESVSIHLCLFDWNTGFSTRNAYYSFLYSRVWSSKYRLNEYATVQPFIILVDEHFLPDQMLSFFSTNSLLNRFNKLVWYLASIALLFCGQSMWIITRSSHKTIAMALLAVRPLCLLYYLFARRNLIMHDF